MNPRLFRALVHGDREKLQRFIEEHADPEARRRLLQGVTPDGDAVLHVAAMFGHHRLARYLYLEGLNPVGGAVDLMARNNRGDTALHCAATAEMVQLLFSIATRDLPPAEQCRRSRELLKATNHDGATCLHEAVRRGRVGVVQRLAEKDDDVVEDSCLPLAQILDGEGASPLYLAATLDRAGSTVFHEIITILTDPIRRNRASYAGPKGRTALHAAVLVNCTIVSKALLDWNAGADRDLRREADESGSTPLHYLASSRSSPAIATLLLQRAAREEEAITSPAYCKDSRGSLPVHVAAGHGRPCIIRMLLEKCPECLWSRNYSGQTILHVAVQKERSDVVACICSLLQHYDRTFTTAILNARDQDGNTALHLAVQRANQPELFRLLLRRKEVDLNIANKEGHTPLDLVFLSGKVDPGITGTEGYISELAFLMSGQRTFRYTQNRHDWMVYDLVIAGASRGVHRWDDMITRLPAKQDAEKDWEKVGKSAGVLAVCAVLILNATLALPFNVAARYHDLEHPPRRRALAFRVFLALDAVAFVSSAVATFSCTYAGFAAAENVSRRSHLFFGASCLVTASFAIVSAFSLGMYAVFGTGFIIFPSLACLLINVATLSGIVEPLRSAFSHNGALCTRLGTRAFLSSLFCKNRRMLCRFCRRHKGFLVLAIALVSYCIFVAINMSTNII